MTAELVKLDKDTVATIAGGFLMRSEQVRQQVKLLVREYPFAAHAAMVAGEFAILDAMSEADKAFISRCRKEGKLLCEGGGNPSEDRCYAVVAQAAAMMLKFPSDDFSVWANGKIYIKENGYRRLLTLHGCTNIDAEPDMPVWRKLQDRNCWEVKGMASAMIGDERVSVDCTIGVNGNVTDAIEKITAHATRSLLKRLYKKVSVIELDEDEADDTLAPEPTAPRVIEHESKPAEKSAQEIKDEMIRAGVCCQNDLKRCRKMLGKDESAISAFEEIWKAFETADSIQALSKSGTEYKLTINTFSADVKTCLTRWYELRVMEIKHGKVEAAS